MNKIELFWKEKIIPLICGKCQDEIAVLIQLNDGLQKTIIEKNSTIDEKNINIDKLNIELESMASTLKSFETQIDDLKAQLTELTTDVPRPNFLVATAKYVPRRRIVSATKDIHVTFKDVKDVFDKSRYLHSLMTVRKLVDVPKTLTNAQKIMTILNSYITYERDKADNWRPVTDTLLAGFGDCEDSGGLVLTSAFGIAGWKEDEVFCAIGDVKTPDGATFCHAWCVVKIYDKWYIAEGTDKNALLQEWEQYKDVYVCNLGLLNWKYDGMIIDGKTYLSNE